MSRLSSEVMEDDVPATLESYYLPTTLYRYRSLEADAIDRELEALSDAYVFCPRFDELNDPMEAEHRVSKVLQRSRRYPAIAAKLDAKVRELGIASFSESRLLEPMWAYYADQFKGICIAYNVTRLLKSLPDGWQLARMGYNETAPLLSILTSDFDERARAVLCAKTVRWAHEREWRLFAPARGQAVYTDHSCVAGVYVGKRIEDATRQRLLEVLDDRKIPAHIMNVDTYKMTFSRRTP